MAAKTKRRRVAKVEQPVVPAAVTPEAAAERAPVASLDEAGLEGVVLNGLMIGRSLPDIEEQAGVRGEWFLARLAESSDLQRRLHQALEVQAFSLQNEATALLRGQYAGPESKLKADILKMMVNHFHWLSERQSKLYAPATTKDNSVPTTLVIRSTLDLNFEGQFPDGPPQKLEGENIYALPVIDAKVEPVDARPEQNEPGRADEVLVGGYWRREERPIESLPLEEQRAAWRAEQERRGIPRYPPEVVRDMEAASGMKRPGFGDYGG